MEYYLSLLVKTIFIENIALSFFLGMMMYRQILIIFELEFLEYQTF